MAEKITRAQISQLPSGEEAYPYWGMAEDFTDGLLIPDAVDRDMAFNRVFSIFDKTYYGQSPIPETVPEDEVEAWVAGQALEAIAGYREWQRGYFGDLEPITMSLEKLLHG